MLQRQEHVVRQEFQFERQVRPCFLPLNSVNHKKSGDSGSTDIDSTYPAYSMTSPSVTSTEDRRQTFAASLMGQCDCRALAQRASDVRNVSWRGTCLTNEML